MAHLARIKPQHRGSTRGGNERRDQGGRAVPGRIAEAERDDEPRPHIVAERDGAQEVVAGSLRELGGGERRRNRAAARMKGPDRVRIVGLVGMGRHAVGERRIDG
jgi:hypothetical protein